MAKISPILLATLMASVLVVIVASEKHWPDLTCHSAYDKDDWRKLSFAFNKKAWKECQKDAVDAQKGVNKKGRKCDKLCKLGSDGLVMQEKVRSGPVEFDISGMVNYLANENGYKSGLGGAEAEKLMEKVRMGMTDCWQKHLEVRSMSVFEVCDKWNPFLSCIDSVFGCK